ncbi:hypothetical protein C9994_06375 [Marivirga lumbricoides]|uniref:Glycosyltransferase subfamily 4-like N-terminal domain-containing protein n=1 Tax=Marivirga lumbricoides TaxID=1046115 RepID=A0A2T4DSH0_9BACT|nr:hypothetical protein C9994_06375 [Marivirga lumbricoides]
MKVILFSTQWPEYMVELANNLSKYTNVTLMMPNNHRFTQEHAKLLDNTVELVQYKLVLHKSIRDNFKMINFILKILWSVKPDILHIQANGHRLFYWVALFKPWKSKIINTIHDPAKHIGDKTSEKIKDDFVKKKSKYFTKRYIVHGHSLIPELVNNYHVSKKSVVSIPHGHLEIYKKFINDSFQTRHKDYVLFFGRIWKYKGLQYFIDAANIVLEKFPNQLFYIVGEGDDLANYIFDQQKMKNFFIDNRRVTLAEAAVYYENASFIVLPYVEATQSGIIPVAYAFSKPVVATRVGAVKEVVLDNNTGLLVEKENCKELANAIEKLLLNKKVLKKYSLNAYKFAMVNLSWDLIAKQTYKTYREVV